MSTPITESPNFPNFQAEAEEFRKDGGSFPDLSHLNEKDPSDLHERLAYFIFETTGQDISAKAVQLVLGNHPKYQPSDWNKKRAEYQARTPQSIYKGAKSLEESLRDIAEAEEAPKPKTATKAAPKTPTKTSTKATASKAANPAKPTPRKRTRKTITTASK